VVRFNAASLYPLLYKLEERGWLQGRWVETAGQRRRRYYRLTAAGKKVLAEQRSTLGGVRRGHQPHREQRPCMTSAGPRRH
jgi:DNA-binding PadR family transcriptional regulator